MNYLITNEAGDILRSGQGSTLAAITPQLQAGEQLYVYDAVGMVNDVLFKVTDNALEALPVDGNLMDFQVQLNGTPVYRIMP